MAAEAEMKRDVERSIAMFVGAERNGLDVCCRGESKERWIRKRCRSYLISILAYSVLNVKILLKIFHWS